MPAGTWDGRLYGARWSACTYSCTYTVVPRPVHAKALLALDDWYSNRQMAGTLPSKVQAVQGLTIFAMDPMHPVLRCGHAVCPAVRTCPTWTWVPPSTPSMQLSIVQEGGVVSEYNASHRE